MKYEINKHEKEILEVLKKDLGCDVPKLSQDRFNNLVDYIVNNEKEYDELLWRLCGCYDESGLNFNKIVDIFIDSRNAYYLAELICFVSDSLDYQHIVDKMIEINDKEFYYCFTRNFWSMIHSYFDYYYEKQMEDFYNKE